MKKIFMFCMAGALALAAASCDDDDEGGGNSGKITVNGQTETVKSALYSEIEAEEFGEKGVGLVLLKDVITGIPEKGPDFGVSVTMTESLYGKTVDLTKPVTLNSHLGIYGINKNAEITISYENGEIDTADGSITQGPTVTGGTLTMTRSGDNFTVKLSVTLSDGSSAAADWKGTATKMEIPE